MIENLNIKVEGVKKIKTTEKMHQSKDRIGRVKKKRHGKMRLAKEIQREVRKSESELGKK